MAQKEEEKKPVEQQEDFSSYSVSVEEVEKHYQTDAENGLTTEEAQRRLEKYGLNKILSPLKKVHLPQRNGSIVSSF